MIPMIDPNGGYHADAPTRILNASGQIVDQPTFDMILAAGWREPTAQEIADKAAAQAEAEAAASLPLQSATGFAVQDSDGHWVELEPTGDGLPVIGVQISNSPLTPEERALMKAERKAAHDALKAAAMFGEMAK